MYKIGDKPAAATGASGSYEDNMFGSDRIDRSLFPELAEWHEVLDRVGLEAAARRRIAVQARLHGVSFCRELLSSGLVAEDALCRALAQHLGIDAPAGIDAQDLLLEETSGLSLLRRQPGTVTIETRSGADLFLNLLIGVENAIVDPLRRLLANTAASAWIGLAPPSAVRRAILGRTSEALARKATHALFESRGHLSARQVPSPRQTFALGVCLVSVAVALAMDWRLTLLAAHILFSLLFLACGSLRLAAVVTGTGRDRRFRPLEPFAPEEMPVYSVLIALYKEADVVPQLLAALGQLQWPRSKLEIKLICERDDRETLAAIRAHTLRPWVEVIEVPNVGPRTKPKALAHALPTSGGELVVLFDAEDRPHPEQLIEAWQVFRRSDQSLACVQAPLEIANRDASIVSRMFAFEYAALFRGLLPWLAQRRLLLPLGGTSNHFRRAALEQVGGWDPYNVTEDADLGIRLLRYGYRTGTITRPTLEDAPEDWSIWLPQRTRWFKGWLQTWLVHMRQPSLLAREIGTTSFLVLQILFAGIFLSALLYPIFLVGLGVLPVTLPQHAQSNSLKLSLLALDLWNAGVGFGAYLVLGYKHLSMEERSEFWKIAIFTPVYWLMLARAALRALCQLLTRPHHWDKTKHVPSRRLRQRSRFRDGGREKQAREREFVVACLIASAYLKLVGLFGTLRSSPQQLRIRETARRQR